MAELEQYRVAREQEETFKARLYRRLVRMRAFLRYGNLEPRLTEIPELEPRVTPIIIEK
jgi:hypothetical protein